MHSFWRDHPIRLRLLALALAAVVVLLLGAVASKPMRAAEEGLGDLAWRLSASAAPERRMVVIDIDEASLRQEGAWPWSRPTLMRLSQRLADAGVAVQMFDIVFPEPKPGDEALAALWSASPVALAQIFSLDPAVSTDVGQAAGALPLANPACPAGVAQSHGVVGNAASLLSARPAVGHITPRIESDGVVRKLPALICHQGRLYPSLELAGLSRAVTGPGAAQPADWKLNGAGSPDQPYPSWLAPAAWVSSKTLPSVTVPVDASGDMRVPYRIQREAMVSVSAADVLAGRADAALLRGAVALIGATAFGIGDAVATPMHSVAAGVEVHAQVIAGLLENRVPYTPTSSPALQMLAMLLSALALLWLASHRGTPAVKSLPLAGLLLTAAVVGGAGLVLVQGNVWLPWADAALFALLASSTLAAAEHALTRAQRERLSAHLQAYLPGPVARRLAATEPTGRLDVVRRDISVLVAEIRNFAAFAAHRPPEETAAVLHAYCCTAADVIERHGGIIESMSGDSIMAVWNAYGDAADHAPRAMRAGQDLLTATQDLFAPQSWLPETSAVQPLALGIGLESGAAIVGSFGPARRRAHAALGEPVTVAARLQSMTQDLSVPILIGPRMAAALPAEATTAQGEFLLEGLSRHCALYAPTAWAEWAPPQAVWPRDAMGSDDESDVPSSARLGAASGPLGQRRAFGDA